MESINVAVENPSIEFNEVRCMAAGNATESFSDPVIIAWKDDNTGGFGPEIPGGSSDRWHDYGVSNDGKLEVTVGDALHFIFSEATDFDEPDLNLSSTPERSCC